VWQVLTDVDAYPAWNPFLRRVTGSLTVGGTLHLRARARFGVPLAFAATVLVCEPAHELRWRGKLGTSWLATGEHAFLIETLAPRRVRLTHREEFGGALPHAAATLLRHEASYLFDAMNHALALRAIALDRTGHAHAEAS
jgi:hypothetical protein